ncbi:MAG: caspase family protein [Phycisphaerae bacterium]|nr:caspase family protein [Phycisphaerae bacterium]
MFSDSNIWRFLGGRSVLPALAVIGLLLLAVPMLAMSNRPLPKEEIVIFNDPNSNSKVTRRAIGVEALPRNEFNVVSEIPSRQSAALFVGVNSFSEDNGLAGLKCAVNDAVEQAYVFVSELKLVKPENCILCLSGEPTNPFIGKMLELLKQSGVEVTTATKPKILQSLRIVGRIGQSRQDIVIVSFSTHGFESRNGVYLMPTDGLRGFLDDTAIYSGTVKDSISKSRAGKKLLILDACRERVENSKSGGTGDAMSERFQRAFAASTGFATLMSCSAGQYSYEDNESGHGVFSKFLLKALRGESPSDQRGFITVGSISEYVSANVSRWMLRNKPEVRADRISTPALAGAEIARHIPLAIGKTLTDAQLQQARVEYVNFYPAVEPAGRNTDAAVNPGISSNGRCVILLNNSQANLRSIMTTQLREAFKKASISEFDFLEESSAIDSKVLAGHLQEARRNYAGILVLCVLETTDQGEKETYGAKFSYYDASVTVKIYDVNSRKVLHNFSVSSTRGSSFSAKAQQDAVTEAGNKASAMLVEWLKDSN